MPRAAWPRVLGAAVLAGLLTACYIELRLSLRGFRASAADSESAWLTQRARASALGREALILVGASRIQLDVDTALLARLTARPVVQLAIDGSSFVPVFENLADDPSVTGTLLVNFMEIQAVQTARDRAGEWAAAWLRERERHVPDFNSIESRLSSAWRAHLAAYADGARPLDSVLSRLLPPRPARQYLVTLPDRSRYADYTRVAMPDFYYARVLRNLGIDAVYAPGATRAALEADLAARVAALPPSRGDLPALRAITTRLATWTRAVRARGGEVIFAMFPVSGLVEQIDRRRFPRTEFWDPFAAEIREAGGIAIHYEDAPGWALPCPDGSHLDVRERADFTRALAAALPLQRP